MIVVIDQKGRLQVPRNIRQKLKLKKKEAFEIFVKDDEISFKLALAAHTIENDPFFKDINERPLHSKVKITKELLEKLKDEMWMGMG